MYPRILSATLFAQIAGFLAFFVPAGIGVQEGALLVALRPVLGAGAGVYAILFRALQVIADAITGALGLLLLRIAPRRPDVQMQATYATLANEIASDRPIHTPGPALRDSKRKPNFFIAGAAKAGTTSLHDYLNQHPQVYLPPHKEPLYFARDLAVPDDWCVRADEAYAALFAPAAPEVTRLGEASVWYLFSKTAAREIHAFDPEARIIIMLRDPIDAMYSLHGQFLWNCNDDIVDFEEAVAAEADRREGRRIPAEAHVPQALQYTDVMTFHPQVERYIDLFGRPNVHVILFEDFARDTAGEFRKVLEFLGVDTAFTPELSVVNAAKPITPGFNRFFARRPGLRRVVRNLVPLWLVRRLNRMLPWFVKTVRRPNRVRPEFRQTLLPRFLAATEKLEALIGRDLSAWKK